MLSWNSGKTNCLKTFKIDLHFLEVILQVIQNRLWCHNLPRKLASKLLCISGSSTENKRKQRLSLLFKRVSFLRNTNTSSFFSSCLFWSLKSGKNLCKLFWGNCDVIVSSGSPGWRAALVLLLCQEVKNRRGFPYSHLKQDLFAAWVRNLNLTVSKQCFNPIWSRVSLGTTPPPLSFFAITLRAFELTLETWWLFPKFNMKSGEIKNFSKLATMVT